jgi:VanZ family protein
MPPSGLRPRPPTRLPQYLATLYGLMIVYASLEPFSGWMAPLPDTPFFLFEPWPPHFTRFDIVVNVLAYVPFGFLLALIGTQRRPAARLATAIGAGAILSFAMESTQMFLPTRDASNVDLLSNSVGATLGALTALAFNRAPGLRARIARWRYRTFLGDRSGDLGLALLGVWLLSQVNPGIPLFAATFDPSLELARDLAGTLLQAAQSAFNVIGVGLFLALLLRQRRHLGVAVLSLIGIALALKGVAAALLLKSASWAFWLEPGIAFGVAAGALVLMLAIWLPRPARTTLCAVALLSSLVAPLLAPDMWRVRAPLALFDWPYGQLLNFNRLTHAVLVIWPVLASAYLLWLAGQPGWGLRGSQSDAGDRV